MPLFPRNEMKIPTLEELRPPVRVDLMKLAWTRYLAALQSPAPTDERRFQRAVSRVRNAVRDDIRNQWNYVARCDAFRNLIVEIGVEGFGKWLQPGDPEIMVFHDAVLEAVASVTVHGREKPRFGRIEFLAQVKKIAQEP